MSRKVYNLFKTVVCNNVETCFAESKYMYYGTGYLKWPGLSSLCLVG